MILISTTGPTALIFFYLDKSLGAAMLSSAGSRERIYSNESTKREF